MPRPLPTLRAAIQSRRAAGPPERGPDGTRDRQVLAVAALIRTAAARRVMTAGLRRGAQADGAAVRAREPKRPPGTGAGIEDLGPNPEAVRVEAMAATCAGSESAALPASDPAVTRRSAPARRTGTGGRGTVSVDGGASRERRITGLGP